MYNFKEKIVYEVYVKSFMDSTGNGFGDIKGIIQKLDYIKSLGVTTIWITPFYESPMKDNGFDISDYYKVSSEMGTMEDIETLLNKCEEMGLEVMLDFVLNHTSNKHLWFQRALAGEKKYQDYYFFFDQPKTEWIGRFGGGVWEYVPSIKKYYLHLYDKTQPDLNWDNPEVRKEMFNVVDFWLQKKVSSYKFDVLYLISKPTDDWKPSGKIPSALACRDGKNVHKYIKELMQKIKQKYPNTYSVGEMSFSTMEECIRYSTPENKEIEIVMTGKIVHALPPNASDSVLREEVSDINIYIDVIKNWYSKFNSSNGWLCSFTENHDLSRTPNNFGDLNYRFESAKAHIMNISFLRGTPFFLQGQELGMTNPDYDDVNDYVDIKSVNAFNAFKNKMAEPQIRKLINRNGRDSGRNPMIWDETKNGGWSKSDHPWRKTNTKFLKSTNVEGQEEDLNSTLNFFKKAIAVRKNNKIFSHGSIKFIDANPKIMAYTREQENEIVLIVINFQSKNSEFLMKDFSLKEVILNNYDFLENDSEKIHLEPWQSIAMKVKKI